MLNNETWLIHSDLLDKHWIVEGKPWARTLGWFSVMKEQLLATGGWMLFGDAKLELLDYVNIIDAVDSEKKLYCYSEGKWQYISGPILLTVKKDTGEHYVVGWAGEKRKLDQLKKKSPDPWKWEGITSIEINPEAISRVKITKPRKKKLPVFFLSNGETNAEENWEHLKRGCSRAIRIDKVIGRHNAFMKCAEQANNVSHFFVVTAKNKITDFSVFDFIPDNSIPQSHVLFQAKNMSNRLEYGHMSVGCYNTDIILDTPENFGLDLTEWGKIYPIPTTVSEATFALTPYEAWRTAFRESVKLTLKDTKQSRRWLNVWLSFAEGDNAEWVIQGASEGHEFALENKDNEEELIKSESWFWLRERFEIMSHLKEAK